MVVQSQEAIESRERIMRHADRPSRSFRVPQTKCFHRGHMSKHLVRSRIPEALYQEVIAEVRRVPGWNLTRAVREGIRSWLAEVEAEEYICLREGGSIIKPKSSPFPPRDRDLLVGRPSSTDIDGDDLRQIAFKMDEQERERLYNALYWRHDYLSHVVRQQLDVSLARLRRIT